MRADKFRLLFFGSDPFSIRVLEHLLNKQICHTEVITKPHTLLDKFSADRQLVRHAWPHGLQHVPIDSHNIGLVASFGSLIDEATVERFRYGLFNVHPSLLPKYRGSTPIQTAIFDGNKETGCTIMRIPPVPKFDVGDIILQEKVNIMKGEYAIHLRDRLSDVGARLTERLLLNYEDSIKKAVPQDGSLKSLAWKLKPEQGRLEFRTASLELIERKIRAYTGFIDLYIECLNGLKVELGEMEESRIVERYELDSLVSRLIAFESDEENNVILNEPTNVIDVGSGIVQPGTMYFHKIRRQLCLKASDNKWAAFNCATPEHKPEMSALEFYNGYLSKKPQNLRLTDA